MPTKRRPCWQHVCATCSESKNTSSQRLSTHRQMAVWRWETPVALDQCESLIPCPQHQDLLQKLHEITPQARWLSWHLKCVPMLHLEPSSPPYHREELMQKSRIRFFLVPTEPIMMPVFNHSSPRQKKVFWAFNRTSILKMWLTSLKAG